MCILPLILALVEIRDTIFNLWKQWYLMQNKINFFQPWTGK